jgi:hypothetical protein
MNVRTQKDADTDDNCAFHARSAPSGRGILWQAHGLSGTFSAIGFTESFAQEFSYRFERLRGGIEVSDAAEESMWHALPHIEFRINPGSDGSLHITAGIVEQDLIVAHVNADRRQSSQVSVER